MKSTPPEAEHAKGAFQIQPQIIIPQARVHISETEHDTTFESS